MMDTEKEDTESSFEASEEKKPSKKQPSPAFTSFLAEFEKESAVENKIRLVIDFMRKSLSQSTPPRFKEYWEGRRLCLPLFKETIGPKERAQLWAEYIELSSEARRLKEILDEQSAFAVEQIDLAIKALEHDLEHYDQMLSQVPEILFPENAPSFHAKRKSYNTLQRELNLLNTFAARLNAMRKEVVKTDMRIRNKSKFFERLSTVGDRIFPKRKELIKRISDAFVADIAVFVKEHFEEGQVPNAPLYVLREEIKSLQGVAKQLTLNTHAFNETRLKLSECWDKMKHLDKERKKEYAEKKQLTTQNLSLGQEKIAAFAAECADGNLTLAQANEKEAAVREYLRGLEFGRDEVRLLKQQLAEARRPIDEKAKREEEARAQELKEQEHRKKERYATFKEHLDKLLHTGESLDMESLVAKEQELLKECEELHLTKSQRHLFDRQFKQLKDLVNDKRKRMILALSSDDLEKLNQLHELLEERRKERQEIKKHLEQYRKEMGGSGLDFEKAMHYRELMESDKQRLDRVDEVIAEIEEQIEQLEG